MKLIKNLLGKLPQARSGRLQVNRFKPQSSSSPIQDAVSLTSTTTEGGQTTIEKQSAFVNLSNGGSFRSDGKKVKFRDDLGLLTSEFDGQIKVDKDSVVIDDQASGKSQRLTADGGNRMFDSTTGLIVDFGPNGPTSILPEGKSAPLSKDQAPSSILSQEWFVAGEST